MTTALGWLDGVPPGWAILGSAGAVMVVVGTIIGMRERRRRRSSSVPAGIDARPTLFGLPLVESRDLDDTDQRIGPLVFGDWKVRSRLKMRPLPSPGDGDPIMEARIEQETPPPDGSSGETKEG